MKDSESTDRAGPPEVPAPDIVGQIELQTILDIQIALDRYAAALAARIALGAAVEPGSLEAHVDPLAGTIGCDASEYDDGRLSIGRREYVDQALASVVRTPPGRLRPAGRRASKPARRPAPAAE